MRGRKGARQLRRHQRRHDPRPRPLRRPPARRAPGRRARRGDGLRGAARPDLPARRQHLADRGDHPRPGDRHPGPGAPGAVPFWRGDGIGRPAELGKAIGAFAREAVNARPEEAGQASTTSTSRAAAEPRQLPDASSRPPPASSPPTRRSWSSASATRSATGASASSRPTAAGSMPPGASALAAKIRDERDLEADAIWSDDGIVIHLPDADEPPPADLVLIEPDEIEDLVDPRALRLGSVRRPLPRERRPLAAASRAPSRASARRSGSSGSSRRACSRSPATSPLPGRSSRPTARCCATSSTCPALDELLRDLHSRKLTLVEVETPTASPFASSLLFDYVATYMYEGDTPNAERRAAALALDRDLLRRAARPGGAARADRPGGARGGRGAAPAPDRGGPGAATATASSRSCATTRRPDRRGVRAARRGGLLGSLDAREAGQRAPGRRGQDRRRGALHRRRGRRPLPRRPRRAAAGGPARELPRAESTDAARRRWSAATRRTHVPFPTRQLADRYGVDPSSALRELERSGNARARRAAARRNRARVVRGRRAAPAAPRQPRPACASEVEADRSARAGPLPAELAERRRPPAAPAPVPDRLREALVLAAGRRADAEDLGARRAAAAARRLQPDLARRALHQRRARLDRRRGAAAAATAGSPSTSARTSGSPARRRPTPSSSARGRDPRRDPRAPRRRARASGSTCSRARTAPPRSCTTALWDLAWSGEVTNDAFAPLRAPRLRAAPAHRARRPPLRPPPRAAARAVLGRWSLTAPLFADAPAAGPRMRAQAELMLERHGIVTRETVARRGHSRRLRHASTASSSNLELLGTARRGYFVEGLGGAQFALPGAVERLRTPAARADGSLQVLAATDPANPYGATLSWPKLEGQRRPARTAGAYVMQRDGRAAALRRARRQGDPPPAEDRRRRARRVRWRRLAEAAAGRPDREARDRARGRRAGDRHRHGGGTGRSRLPPPAAQARRLMRGCPADARVRRQAQPVS